MKIRKSMRRSKKVQFRQLKPLRMMNSKSNRKMMTVTLTQMKRSRKMLPRMKSVLTIILTDTP